MIDYETFARIKHLHEQKSLEPTQIAQELALDLRTVARWLAEKRFRSRDCTVRPSILDPFKDDIIRMLESHPYTAQQVLLHKVRPSQKSAFLTLAFAPGECAQVDWGSYGSIKVGDTSRRLSFFVMVLCYSRQIYVEFTVSQTMEHFLACHVNAFTAFGGVPARIMVDNLKSAALKHALGQVPTFNPKYQDFASHHGFIITACGVRKPNEKGRVENGVGYVKKNFLAGTELPDFMALAPAVKLWLDSVANVQIHGETRKKPVDMLMEEQPHLHTASQPL
jgi:transposase